MSELPILQADQKTYTVEEINKIKKDWYDMGRKEGVSAGFTRCAVIILLSILIVAILRRYTNFEIV